MSMYEYACPSLCFAKAISPLCGRLRMGSTLRPNKMSMDGWLNGRLVSPPERHRGRRMKECFAHGVEDESHFILCLGSCTLGISW